MDCGVLEHDMDCLCDVVIVEPTPVNFTTKDHWLLSMVAEHFDIHLDESQEQFGFLLEKCLEFLVVYQIEKGVFDTSLYKKRGGHTGNVGHGEAPALLYQRVREKAETMVHSRLGNLTVYELRDLLGLDTDKFLQCISFGKQKGLTMERLQEYLELRREGKSHRASSTATGFTNYNRKSGVNGWLCRTFIDPYDKVRA